MTKTMMLAMFDGEADQNNGLWRLDLIDLIDGNRGYYPFGNECDSILLDLFDEAVERMLVMQLLKYGRGQATISPIV